MDTFSDMVSICKGKKKKRTDKTDTSDAEGLQVVEEASSRERKRKKKKRRNSDRELEVTDMYMSHRKVYSLL